MEADATGTAGKPRCLNILFLGGAKRVSMGEKFIAAGEKLGVRITLFSYELTPWVPIASIARIITGKRWRDEGILEDIHSHVAENNIDIMVPFVDGAVEVAACYRDRYNDVWVPAGDAVTSALMFDKTAADALFRRYGLPVPGKERFPMIAKPRFGSASKGIKIIESADTLTVMGERAEDYLLQEYIADRREITVDCYVSLDGRIISAVPRYRVETQGGEASVTRTFRDRKVEELAAETLRQTGLRGAVTIQMLIDNSSGCLMLMEINPRLGGGAVCSCIAGAPLPEFILRDCLGLPLVPCDDWKADILVTRYFAEVSFNLAEKQ